MRSSSPYSLLDKTHWLWQYLIRRKTDKKDSCTGNPYDRKSQICWRNIIKSSPMVFCLVRGTVSLAIAHRTRDGGTVTWPEMTESSAQSWDTAMPQGCSSCINKKKKVACAPPPWHCRWTLAQVKWRVEQPTFHNICKRWWPSVCQHYASASGL